MALLAPVAVLVVVVGVALVGRAGTGMTAAADSAAAPQEIPALSAASAVISHRREAGTDGLMGRLPFDRPPYPVAPLVNRFTIDDVAPTRLAWDTTPPWVRRLGFPSSYQTDPYMR